MKHDTYAFWNVIPASLVATTNIYRKHALITNRWGKNHIDLFPIKPNVNSNDIDKLAINPGMKFTVVYTAINS